MTNTWILTDRNRETKREKKKREKKERKKREKKKRKKWRKKELIQLYSPKPLLAS